MELVFESDKYFNLYDFHISLKQLLIRGDKIVNDKLNIDIVFVGTEFLNCPTKFEGIKIFILSEQDIIENDMDNTSNHRIFMIITQNKEYYIKAGNLRIYKNNLGFYESSIDLSGLGQEDIVWINKD